MSPLSKEIVNIKAELVADGVRHPCIVESLCDQGIYVRVLPEHVPVELPSGTTVTLNLLVPSGQPLSIRCEVKWSYKTPPHSLTTSVGLNILTPFLNYEEILRTEN